MRLKWINIFHFLNLNLPSFLFFVTFLCKLLRKYFCIYTDNMVIYLHSDIENSISEINSFFIRKNNTFEHDESKSNFIQPWWISRYSL